MSIRVILGEDHKIVRESLRSLLDREPNIEVVGEAQDGRAAIKMCEELSPDLAIIDVLMPGLNGIEATRQITTKNPKIKVVALSMYSDKRFILSMMRVGASGYLIKECAFDELVQAVWAVSANRTFFSPNIRDTVIEDYISRLQKDDIMDSSITAREREVLQLIAEGKNTREIASILSISVKTVETHRWKIMDELNIHTIAGLTKYAIREGLASLEE